MLIQDMVVNFFFPASTNSFCPSMSSLKRAHQTTGSSSNPYKECWLGQASVTL